MSNIRNRQSSEPSSSAKPARPTGPLAASNRNNSKPSRNRGSYRFHAPVSMITHGTEMPPHLTSEQQGSTGYQVSNEAELSYGYQDQYYYDQYNFNQFSVPYNQQNWFSAQTPFEFQEVTANVPEQAPPPPDFHSQYLPVQTQYSSNRDPNGYNNKTQYAPSQQPQFVPQNSLACNQPESIEYPVTNGAQHQSLNQSLVPLYQENGYNTQQQYATPQQSSFVPSSGFYFNQPSQFPAPRYNQQESTGDNQMRSPNQSPPWSNNGYHNPRDFSRYGILSPPTSDSTQFTSSSQLNNIPEEQGRSGVMGHIEQIVTRTENKVDKVAEETRVMMKSIITLTRITMEQMETKLKGMEGSTETRESANTATTLPLSDVLPMCQSGTPVTENQKKAPQSDTPIAEAQKKAPRKEPVEPVAPEHVEDKDLRKSLSSKVIPVKVEPKVPITSHVAIPHTPKSVCNVPQQPVPLVKVVNANEPRSSDVPDAYRGRSVLPAPQNLSPVRNKAPAGRIQQCGPSVPPASQKFSPVLNQAPAGREQKFGPPVLPAPRKYSILGEEEFPVLGQTPADSKQRSVTVHRTVASSSSTDLSETLGAITFNFLPRSSQDGNSWQPTSRIVFSKNQSLTSSHNKENSVNSYRSNNGKHLLSSSKNYSSGQQGSSQLLTVPTSTSLKVTGKVDCAANSMKRQGNFFERSSAPTASHSSVIPNLDDKLPPAPTTVTKLVAPEVSSVEKQDNSISTTNKAVPEVGSHAGLRISEVSKRDSVLVLSSEGTSSDAPVTSSFLDSSAVPTISELSDDTLMKPQTVSLFGTAADKSQTSTSANNTRSNKEKSLQSSSKKYCSGRQGSSQPVTEASTTTSKNTGNVDCTANSSKRQANSLEKSSAPTASPSSVTPKLNDQLPPVPTVVTELDASEVSSVEVQDNGSSSTANANPEVETHGVLEMTRVSKEYSVLVMRSEAKLESTSSDEPVALTVPDSPVVLEVSELSKTGPGSLTKKQKRELDQKLKEEEKEQKRRNRMEMEARNRVKNEAKRNARNASPNVESLESVVQESEVEEQADPTDGFEQDGSQLARLATISLTGFDGVFEALPYKQRMIQKKFFEGLFKFFLTTEKAREISEKIKNYVQRQKEFRKTRAFRTVSTNQTRLESILMYTKEKHRRFEKRTIMNLHFISNMVTIKKQGEDMDNDICKICFLLHSYPDEVIQWDQFCLAEAFHNFKEEEMLVIELQYITHIYDLPNRTG